MARPLRLEFAGALYHVTSRGDRQEAIYLDDTDRQSFLALLCDVRERYNWLIHAWCLMDNHYHLLIETPDGNLSQGMRQLNGVYTQASNTRHHRVGHVFQGRYTAILVQKETYLLELARYIVLNPVRARMVRTARDWSWSSYRDTAGYRKPADWLTTDWLLSAFGGEYSEAVKRYREFVRAGKGQPSPWESLRNQIYLGSEEFVQDLLDKAGAGKDLGEVPRAQRRAVPKSLDYYERHASSRNEAICRAYESGGFSMKEIGDYFGLHYSRVSRVLKGARKAIRKT